MATADVIQLRPGTPHNIEAEQALLGALFVDNAVHHRVSSFLESDHFYDGIHGEIYAAAGRLISEGRAVTPTTLAPFFTDCGPLEPGGLTVGQYLGRLLKNATTTMCAPDYGRTIRELAMRRDLQQAARQTIDDAAAMHIGLSDIAANMGDTANDVLSNLVDGKKTRFHVAEAAADVLEVLDSGAPVPSTTTGLTDLDRCIGGYFPAELTIIAGRTSMGKSLLAASTALTVARQGLGVGYFSLEMPVESLAQRILSDLIWNRQTPVEYRDMRKRKVSDADRQRLREALPRLSELPLEIDDSPALTVAQIAAKARVMAQTFERKGQSLDLLIIDHLGKIRPSNRYRGHKVQETGETSGALAALAKTLGVPVVALCQINREPEKESDNRPKLSHLAWSSQIEQDADNILLLFRHAYYLERASHSDQEKEQKRLAALDGCRYELEVIVAKQRNGPLGIVTVFCDPGSNVIRDASTSR